MSTFDFPPMRIQVLAAAEPVGWPAWRVGMAANEWKELPNTKLSSVQFSPAPPGNTVWTGKINAENGLAIRNADSTLIRFGGGHLDYAGNEVDALTLAVDEPAWQQVCTPTPNAEIKSDASWWGTAPNEKPNPPHTYCQSQFIDADDTLYQFRRSFVYANAGSFSELVAFDWTTKRWLPPGTYGSVPGGTMPNVCQNGLGTGVYMLNRSLTDTLYHWTYDTKVFTAVGKTNHVNGMGAIVYDSNRHRIFRFGYTSLPVVSPRTVDLATGANLNRTLSGDPLIVDALMNGRPLRERPGIAFDAALDAYLIHSETAGNIYTIDAETFEVGTLATTGGAGIPNAAQKGVCFRFIYAKNLGGYAYLPNYDSNVWFLARE